MKRDHGFRLGDSGRGEIYMIELWISFEDTAKQGLMWEMREQSKMTQGYS